MVDRRRANKDWKPADEDGTITWERVDTALLMDLRDELQKLNALFRCHNFLGMPGDLRALAKDAKRRNRLAEQRARRRRAATIAAKKKK